MQPMCQKLKNEQGVSILIALVFFLFCAVVGTLLLTGAMANVAPGQDRYEEQQDYLAISSAARLLKETLTETEANRKLIESEILDSTITDSAAYPHNLLQDSFLQQTTDITEFEIVGVEGLPIVTVTVSPVNVHSSNVTVELATASRRYPLLLTFTQTCQNGTPIIKMLEDGTTERIMVSTYTWTWQSTNPILKGNNS